MLESLGFASFDVSAWEIIFIISATFFLYSHISYNQSRGPLKGPSWVPPILGNIVSMVRDPTAFWDKQVTYAPDGMSVNNIAGQLVVFVTNPRICRTVFCKVRNFMIFAHPAANYLLGSDNFIYMGAEEHKKFRALLLTGFYGKEQLALYLKVQEKCVRQCFAALDGKGFVNVRQPLRVMAAHASQYSLLGDYPSQEEQDILAEEYRWLTEAFLGFPIPFPGNGLWKGIRARKTILKILIDVSKRSKENILKKGLKATCGTDFWVEDMKKAGEDRIEGDYNMGNAILDFLFASQDATTSALAWTLALLEQYPDVCEKVRTEISEVCGESGSISAKYDELEYTQKVAREILRRRPPVPMVPHITRNDQQITDDFMAPKGTMIVPSVTGAASAQGVEREFDPDLMDDKDFNQTLVFGAGPHKCLGRKIAINLIALTVAVVCRDYHLERKKSKGCDDIRYLPTLYPMTNIFSLKRRTDAEAKKA